MPKCDTCPVHREVEDSPKGSMLWEDLPCKTCQLEVTPANHGRTHVSFDEMPEHELLGIIHELPDFEAQERGQAQKVLRGLSAEQRQSVMILMQHVLSTIIRMDSVTRDVVCMRMLGYGYADIATSLGVGMSTVATKHKRALQTHPLLQVAFPSKHVQEE